MKKIFAIILALASLATTTPAAVMSSYPVAPYIEPPDLLLITHYPNGNTNNPQTYNLQATNLGLTANFSTDTNQLNLFWAGNPQLSVATNEFNNTFGYVGQVGGAAQYNSANPNGYSAKIYITNGTAGMMVIPINQKYTGNLLVLSKEWAKHVLNSKLRLRVVT